jgi:hypothetical protein
MSDYTKITEFTPKDSLPTGDPEKVVTGTELDAEFDAIEAALNSKADTVGGSTVFALACSDLTTDLTTGDDKGYFRAPGAFTLTSVRASLLQASDSGSVTIDVRKNGTTIFSTKITIDVNETTSTTAAVPAVLSTTTVVDDDLFQVDIDGAGANAKGLIVTFLGTG